MKLCDIGISVESMASSPMIFRDHFSVSIRLESRWENGVKREWH